MISAGHEEEHSLLPYVSRIAIKGSNYKAFTTASIIGLIFYLYLPVLLENGLRDCHIVKVNFCYLCSRCLI